MAHFFNLALALYVTQFAICSINPPNSVIIDISTLQVEMNPHAYVSSATNSPEELHRPIMSRLPSRRSDFEFSNTAGPSLRSLPPLIPQVLFGMNLATAELYDTHKIFISQISALRALAPVTPEDSECAHCSSVSMKPSTKTNTINDMANNGNRTPRKDCGRKVKGGGPGGRILGENSV